MIKSVMLVIVMAAFIAALGYVWINTPVVQVSSATGDCVSVLPTGNCDALPRRYQVEYVK